MVRSTGQNTARDQDKTKTVNLLTYQYDTCTWRDHNYLHVWCYVVSIGFFFSKLVYVRGRHGDQREAKTKKGKEEDGDDEEGKEEEEEKMVYERERLGEARKREEKESGRENDGK